MTGLVLHLAALFAATCLGTSLLASALVRSLDARLASIEPRARFRLLFVALLVPLAAAIAVVVGVVLPHQWLGLVDHCLDHPGHLHLCLVHGTPLPQAPLLALAAASLGWSGVRLLGSARNAFRSASALRRIVGAARREGDLRVLPGEAPVAFTAGLLAPAIVVSEAVAADPRRWGAVLEHERAHAACRDPLLRWLADALTAFHLPGLGADLVARLRVAQELAADESAAQAIGCRVHVAETLVEWTRWSCAQPQPDLGFDSGPLALRVHRLLDPETYRSGPSRPRVLVGAAALAVAVLFIALPLHHAVETLFGFFLP